MNIHAQTSSLLPRDPFIRGMLFLGVLIALLTLSLRCAYADDDWRDLHRQVERGEIRPLGEILDTLSHHWFGDVIDVELERDGGKVIYEIELLGPQGQVVEFEIDARTGEVLEIEGQNIREMERR